MTKLVDFRSFPSVGPQVGVQAELIPPAARSATPRVPSLDEPSSPERAPQLEAPRAGFGGVAGGAYRLTPMAVHSLLPAAETEAAPAPAAPPTPEAKLQKAIETGDVLEVVALMKETPTLLERRNENGLTPLFDALTAKQPQIAALLAHLGADLKANINLGFHALSYALRAKDDRAVRLFTETPKLAEALHDPLWHPPGSLHTLLDELAKKSPKPEELDAAATQLVWQAAPWFRNAYQLQKLLTHSESLKENPLGVEPEAWFREHFLLMRTRNLLKVGVDTPAQDRDGVARELSTTLEALRVERRMNQLYHTESPALRQRAAEHEIESVLRRVEDKAFPLVEYVIPCGWPKHAIYMSLEKRAVGEQAVLTLRIDNRGVGHARHAVDGLRVHPRVVNVPTDAASRLLLKTFLLQAMLNEMSGSEAGFYDALEVLSAKLLVAHGPLIFEPVRDTHEKIVRQMAGNCAMANFEPGVRRRLGTKAADDLKAHEFVDVRDRLFAQLTPAALSEEVQENRERIAGELQKSEQAQKR